jgi:hypothetical protein
MKKILGVALVAVMVLAVAGAAMAQWGGPGQGYGRHGGMMGRGTGGPGAGFGPGGGPCGRQQGAAPATATAIDEAKAKEIASEYVSKNLPGYQVEKFVKFDRPRGSMYQVEVKGPQGELQYLHINPWGNVRTFGAGRTF